MAETLKIKTQTLVSLLGTGISILTRYISNNSGIIEAFIVPGLINKGGVSFLQGEGGVTIVDSFYPSKLNASTNNKGELIVSGSNSQNLSIDQNTGQLVYTY